MRVGPTPLPVAQGSSGKSEKNPVWDLHKAIQNRDHDGVLDALQRGADANFANYDASNLPALSYAVNLASPEIVRTLLRWGANPNQPDRRGYTPLYKALSQDKFEMADMLLDYGGNPDVRAKAGMPQVAGLTLIHDRAKKFDVAGIEKLVMVGADPFVLDDNGKTPYESITGIGSYSTAPHTVLAYLEHAQALPLLPAEGVLTKATLFAKDARGKCPLDNPVNWRKLPEILVRLQEAGEQPFTKAELMQEGANGITYLEQAARARALDTLVADFNQRGESFSVEDITAVSGLDKLKGSAHLARAIFTEQNTAGWTPSQLRSNYASLTEEVRGDVQNYNQLSQRARATSNARTGLGR